jgi:hypothetical protein
MSDAIAKILLLLDCPVVSHREADSAGDKPDMGMLRVHAAIDERNTDTFASYG